MREPALIDYMDDALHYKNGGAEVRRRLPWLVDNFAYKAHNFHLDDEAVFRLLRLYHDRDLLNDLREFSRPPYERFSIQTMMGLDEPDGSRGVTDCLFLVDWTDLEDRKFAWTFLNKVPDGPGDRQGFYLEASHPPTVFPDQPISVRNEKIAMANDVIDAFCLLMLAKRIETTSEWPKVRSFRSGRRVTYYARNEVTIRLDPIKGLKRDVKAGDRSSPRRHEVRGHYIHRGGQRHGCIHEWELIDEADPNRYHCVKCDRKRTWRAAFDRGDAGKGWVRKMYKVAG